MDNVTAAEKAMFGNNVTIVEALGYAAGSEVPVATKTYSLAGTATLTSWRVMPGDVAALIRYATAARSTKNHPVYLFNYYHGIGGLLTGDQDVVNTSQAALMSTYATSWISGFSDGAVTYNRAGPNGAAATGSLVEPYLTHRDLPH